MNLIPKKYQDVEMPSDELLFAMRPDQALAMIDESYHEQLRVWIRRDSLLNKFYAVICGLNLANVVDDVMRHKYGVGTLVSMFLTFFLASIIFTFHKLDKRYRKQLSQE